MRPSDRLVRAVAAERADLERRRAQLTSEADELRAALSRIERGLTEIDAQCALLDRLAPQAETSVPASEQPRGSLRGPAIRAAAVEVLVARGEQAMHYRDWYEVLVRAGHEVAGKDPLAVFLTQLGRSPVIRRTGKPGTYALDRAAPEALRTRLDRLHRELKELTGDDLTAIRARRQAITKQIADTEKAIDEAVRVLENPQRDAA
jgi:septal ring factor EnvC (AmiA/AmiB activator)